MNIVKAFRNKSTKGQQSTRDEDSNNKNHVKIVNVDEDISLYPETKDVEATGTEISNDGDDLPTTKGECPCKSNKWRAVRIHATISLVFTGIILTCLLVFGGGVWGFVGLGVGILVNVCVNVRMMLRKH